MNKQPKRPPAFRCPEHGWVTLDRLAIDKAYRTILVANREWLSALPDCDMDTLDARAGEITSRSEADLLAAFWWYGMTPQLQYPIDRYHADFCFVDDRFVVEVDGREWHTNAAKDERRRQVFRQHGFRTMRYPASEVWRDPLNCAQQIRRELERLRRIAAREVA